jgi:hypothetical protein
MIIEIVTFKSGHAGNPVAELASAKTTIAKWQANPDLVRKQYFRDGQGNVGAVYTWKSMAAAKAAHDAKWCAMVEQRDGGRPAFQYYGMFMQLDNAAGTVTEY